MDSFIKYKILILIIMLLFPVITYAQRGCCSHHGGVAGCSQNGKQICRDGTLSPTCTCTPTVTYIYGCTDSSAKNYNSKANKDNGSCQYYIYGCTDPKAKNYNKKAEKDNNSCEYYNYGCMDSKAINYNESADKDDGSCEYKSIVKETSDDDSSGILPVLTIGGIGASIYYFKKKNK